MKLMTYNFHFIQSCNAKCNYCFAQFPDAKGLMSHSELKKIITLLKEHSGYKINFVGGEPTLYKQLPDLIKHARAIGFKTSIVTNGFALSSLLEQVGHDLDWIGLSIDSAKQETNLKLGRANPKEDLPTKIKDLADLCHQYEVGLKINTVVSSVNVHEDMSEYILSLKPQRWKVFQVLPVLNQNGATINDLLISQANFNQFLERHNHLNQKGIVMVPEDNHAMTNSYAMLDPQGRFMGNEGQIQSYSDPVLEVGVIKGLKQIGFDYEKLVDRGGVY